MKTYGGSGDITNAFLTSALDGGEWSASCPGSFTPEENTQFPSVRRTCGLQNRSGEIITAPTGNRTPIVQAVTQSYKWDYPCSIFWYSAIIIQTPIRIFRNTEICGQDETFKQSSEILYVVSLECLHFATHTRVYPKVSGLSR
jgi:hypothetical protein